MIQLLAALTFSRAKIVLIRIPLDFGVNFAWSLWADISKESSQKTEVCLIILPSKILSINKPK